MDKHYFLEMENNLEGVVENYEKERETPFINQEQQNNGNKKYIPAVSSRLRHRYVMVPEVIYRASGIIVMKKRIKSLIFSTDIAIIRNNDAGAILAVYPFTPEITIMQAVTQAASAPVFLGIGGGTTNGRRSLLLGFLAELMGAYGVVVNAPMSSQDIHEISKYVDIPVVATIISPNDPYKEKVQAGAKILNVSAGKDTAKLVRKIRRDIGNEFPIIATGGHREEHILKTIDAGANAISYTPPSSADIFGAIMEEYRHEKAQENQEK
ncbi:MAG: hydrolase [Firmicutes bacterium]|nr:hydrolase [Bacillota bacterium]